MMVRPFPLLVSLVKQVSDCGMVYADIGALDLDEDWDPEKHDRQMAGLYDESRIQVLWRSHLHAVWIYYINPCKQDDSKKPVWEDDIDVDDIVPDQPSTHKSKKRRRDEGEDEGEDEEAFGAEDEEAEPWDGAEETRQKKLDQYMEELYKMEFEDVVSFLFLSLF